ncbi:alpha/beta hydrolase [Sphingobium sp.]|uniref:alpha/beta hydrolase n=1 Tax=Sphingobium sp. TaxID=1912891 RepID=UPI002C160238|nr:dienelactone hydrolase family protein [Sphingobium sp.]HUD90112.1 dienelactone hydrolase family protein [Sphingobium sp.]
MEKIVNGASLQPLSGERPKRIVLLLHGFGSSGADMIALAPAWRQAMPETLFLAPHAPQRGPMHGGYQWWPLGALSSAALAAGAASAAPAIDAFIDRKLDQYSLSEADLAIVGFSQGTMMALHVGLRRRGPVAAIVGYSGMLAGTADLHPETLCKPPILLIHGSQDSVVPPAALRIAEKELQRLRLPVTTHLSMGLDHSVDLEGLNLGCAFVNNAFGR